MMKTNVWRYVATVAAMGVVVAGASAAHLEYVGGNFGGQRGGGVVMASHENAGSIEHWDAGFDLPPDGYASSHQRLTAGSETVGWAHLDLDQEGRVTATGSQVDIMLHSTLNAQASSAGGTLRYWQVASHDPVANPTNVAHADSHVQQLTYRIVPDAGESIGDSVTLRVDGSLSVNNGINGVGYGRPADVAAYHVSGWLDGGYPDPFTYWRKAYDGDAFTPLVQASGWPEQTQSVFSHEYRTVTIGDEIRVNGGVQPYLNIYHHQEERGAEVGVYEQARAEQRFTSSLRLVSTGPTGTAEIANDQFGAGSLDGWSPTAGPGGLVAAIVRPDASDDYALRLFDPAIDPVRISKMIQTQPTLRVAFDYYAPLAGQLDIILDGVTLDSFELLPIRWVEFRQYNRAFDLSDFGLTPGEGLLEIKLSDGGSPDPDVMLDNIALTTWSIPEPATLVWLVCAGLLARRRR